MNLPRVSRKNTETAVKNLVAAKYLKSEISKYERVWKQYLEEKVLNSGENKRAYTDSGAEIGVVSRTKKTLGQPVVADEAAFVEWLRVHEPADFEDFVQTVTVLKPQAVGPAQLAAYIARNDGDVPDGVVMTEEKEGHIRVSQSASQALNMLDEINTLSGLAGVIEAGEEE